MAPRPAGTSASGGSKNPSGSTTWWGSLRNVSENPGRSPGLPIVKFSEGFNGPIDAQRVDVREAFSVGFGEDFVEIDLGNLAEAQRVVVAGTAEFYVGAVGLVGVRVIGLTEQQVSMLKAQRAE